MQITVPRIIQSIANQYTNAFTLREVKFIYIYTIYPAKLFIRLFRNYETALERGVNRTQ